MVTTDVRPDVCLMCGYLTFGLDLCYFCRCPVVEPLDREFRPTFHDSSACRTRRSRTVKAAS